MRALIEDLTNAFRVIKNQESYTYRSETLEDKQGLLNSIKSTAEEAVKRDEEGN